MDSKKFSIASDHGGFLLKEELVSALKNSGFVILDRGPSLPDSVDYPDFAKLVCNDISNGSADFGVLICTTGIGMSIAANKCRGIRAALCHNEDSAKFSRLHNNANVLCMGAKYVDLDLARKIFDTFSTTQFEGGRHARRVGKFMDFEHC